MMPMEGVPTEMEPLALSWQYRLLKLRVLPCTPSASLEPLETLAVISVTCFWRSALAWRGASAGSRWSDSPTLQKMMSLGRLEEAPTGRQG